MEGNSVLTYSPCNSIDFGAVQNQRIILHRLFIKWPKECSRKLECLLITLRDADWGNSWFLSMEELRDFHLLGLLLPSMDDHTTISLKLSEPRSDHCQKKATQSNHTAQLKDNDASIVLSTDRHGYATGGNSREDFIKIQPKAEGSLGWFFSI